jgi:hypothetical protein
MKSFFGALALLVGFSGSAAAFEVIPYESLCFSSFAEFDKSRESQYPKSRLAFAALQGPQGEKVFGLWKGPDDVWFATSQRGADDICVIGAGTDWKAAE